MNNRNSLVALALVFAVSTPMLALAKKPHPAPLDPAPVINSCTCDEFLLNTDAEPDQWESLCDVQWTVLDGMWSAYGASIEFEAEWEDGSEMSAESDTDVDEYECVLGEFGGTFEVPPLDQQCTATDVPVIIPLFSDTGSVDFEAKVKGFDSGTPSGEPGEKSRDYVKVSGECFDPPVLID